MLSYTVGKLKRHLTLSVKNAATVCSDATVSDTVGHHRIRFSVCDREHGRDLGSELLLYAVEDCS